MTIAPTAAAVAPAKALPVATPAQMAKIHDTAKSFEAELITQMLQPMFNGLSTDGPFGGGPSESTYRTFMMDAFGKQMSRAGGIGVSSSIEREMLKMQGLSEGPLA
jgi:Rod binding domain-containing protein